MIRLTVNKAEVRAAEGTTVAAAIMNSGEAGFRRTADGSYRAPLCGIGICFECRVTIDGQPHRRSCIILVAEGMEVVTD